MTKITVQKVELPIQVHVKVNDHEWKLSEDEARVLRAKITEALDMDLIDQIKILCARKFYVKISAIDSRQRTDQVCRARHAGIWLCSYAGLAQNEVARRFGVEHGTVSWTRNHITDKLGFDGAYRSIMRFLISEARHETNASFIFDDKITELLAKV